MSLWRSYGGLVNTKVGRFLLDHDGGLVAGVAARAMAVDLDGPPPWHPLGKPVREARVALVTTAGVHTADQPPFDVDALDGDPSFRVIPGDADLAELRVAHTHYPTERARADLNVVFPLERLREAAREGGVGAVAPRHIGFGFFSGSGRLIGVPDGSAHQAAALLAEDRVDLALLVPG